MSNPRNLLDWLEDVTGRSFDRRTFIKAAAAAGATGAAAGLAAPTAAASVGNDPFSPGTCLSCHGRSSHAVDYVVEPCTDDMINWAHGQGIDLLWDRGPSCQFAHAGGAGAAGLCCFRCQMGPCTLGDPTGAERGACGATRDIIVTRDLVRRIAGGTSAHVEHARAAARTLRGVGLGTARDYRITDRAKLDALYRGLCERDGGHGRHGMAVGHQGNIAASDHEKALAVAEASLRDLGRDEGTPAWLELKASAERKKVWSGLGILPTGAGTEVTQAEHRTTMGVDGDLVNLATDGLKLGLVDGYCGLHMASGLQDVLFGTPMMVRAKANLAVIDPKKINLVVNGHEPILSEMVVEAADRYNHTHRSTRINVVGMCCTGNEVLMRRGVNLAGAMVQQELAIATGAVDVMVVDVQCIVPNVQDVASRFHTKIVTTNPHARITGATHIEFSAENAAAVAQQIVDLAVANYANRNPNAVHVPPYEPRDIVAGFSVEQIVAALSKVNPTSPLKPLVDNIAANNIRGIVAIVGCATPRDSFGYRHVTLTRRLIAENVLVVGTGCWGHVAGQYGLLTADPTYPGVGSGLKAVLQAVAAANGLAALPPCWHMGSCVDNARIEDVANAIAAYLGVTVSQLPVAASAPELITEKAVSIGTWAVDLGLFTHVGRQPYVAGSPALVQLLTSDVADLTGGRFFVESNPEKAATAILGVLNDKRRALGLPT
jgi:carbon-monoxide dehydrogenase catalytic subunit